ncbi:MAG: diaminopimelate decarboxylase [Gemmatimonadetes bacterium]|nr:diaminopimelate decarboxylase [Gemmatimonadota bacterium]
MIERELTERIVREVGTPTYIYSADRVRSQFAILEKSLTGIPHKIHYSAKANSNRSILELMRSLGAGADIVSAGELHRCIRAGMDPREIVFSGVGKTRAELEYAIESGVGLINVESFGELKGLAETAKRLNTKTSLGIRINPNLATDTHPYIQTGHGSAKFGVSRDDAKEMVAWLRENAEELDLISLGVHLGSQIARVEPYKQAMRLLVDLAAELTASGVDTLQSLDLGGGLAIDYGETQAIDAESLFGVVKGELAGTDLTLLIEPGRFLLGNAGLLVMTVLYTKCAGSRNVVVVDAGMNDFIRPSLYGAKHRIEVVGDEAAREKGTSTIVDVVGPVCETGDYLGQEVRLGVVEEGALLAVHGAGAYGFSMSSTYNSRLRPCEVLVEQGKFAVIRERGKIEDLARGEAAELNWR